MNRTEPDFPITTCLGRPKFDRFHSISFPSLPAETTFACLRHQGNALFSPLLPASNFGEPASIWTALWPESMHLVSVGSISHSFTNLRWTLRNSANSSSEQKYNRCKKRCAFLQRSKSLQMPFPFPLPGGTRRTCASPHIRVFDYRYHASS